MWTWTSLSELVEAQRGAVLLWMPVALSVGIGCYFGMAQEPALVQYSAFVITFMAGSLALFVLRARFGLAYVLTILIALGFSISGYSSHRISAPTLSYHFYGSVEGRVIAVDRSSSGVPRVTLDQVVLDGVGRSKTPLTVRISLHAPVIYVTPEAGQRVMVTATLSPPAGPVEPGGFDFQRYAWFRQLGAVGYARSPMLRIGASEHTSLAIRIAVLRGQLASALHARLEGQTGAFAAAILVGDRSAVDPVVLDRLRASNLAHLLAISGLHMGLLTGFVFGAIRYGLALVPWLALRLPGKKIAAGFALSAAGTYLVLSGANIATQRAFVMVAVMLLAVLLDRRAITLRAVALAALIILLFRPVSLVEAGFQMSFAATTALVATFGAMRDSQWLGYRPGRLWKVLHGAGTLVLSSAIAGLATAPVAAFHFNQVAQFGLVANLLSVPVMGMVIMPAAVVGLILAPLGIDQPAWEVMGAGIDWILHVANWVASMDQAVRPIPKPDPMVLPILGLGLVLLAVLRGPARSVGLMPFFVGFVLWAFTERPSVLVSDNGRVLGVLTADGRAINRAKGNGFVVRNWLENDGDLADQADAAERDGFNYGNDMTVVKIGDQHIAYRWGKGLTTDQIQTYCDKFDLVVVPQFKGPSIRGCSLVTLETLSNTGALAIDLDAAGQLRLITAYPPDTRRLWSR